PIVASAVTAVQSFAKSNYDTLLSPRDMRSLLKETGTPQGSGGNIGPLPNIKTAIETLEEELGGPDTVTWTLSVTNGSGSGKYSEGTIIPVSAKDSAGYIFTEWTGDVDVLAAVNEKNTDVTMGTADVHITATYEQDTVIVDTLNPSTNLLDWAYWGAYTDDFGGSAVDTGTALLQSETAAAEFTIGSSDSVSGEWSYGGISATLPPADTNTLDQVTHIKVIYTADNNFTLTLPQAPLDETGESYGAAMAATESSADTLLLAVKDFAQPDWSSSTTALDPSAVKGLIFEPVLPYGGGNATISISEVILYNYQGGTETATTTLETTAPTASQTIVKQGDQLILRGFTDQAGTVSIYSLQGRLLLERTVDLSAGSFRLKHPKGITGMNIIRVETGEETLMQKLQF
ncbi:MAG: InlB B-repeat-containing protein, partial [Fibrobacterota bacterium]